MILAAMVVIGVILYATDVFYYRRKHKDDGSVDGDRSVDVAAGPEDSRGSESGDETLPSGGDEAESEVCCGMHMVCEKTNLSPLTGEIVYYDDEELDRFRGREADGYTTEEVEEFRDVLMTLLPKDVAGWSRSIQVRGVTLPTEIRDELLLIVSELMQIEKK